MLPSEVAAALLDAAISFDSKRNVVLVTRGVHGVLTQQKQKRAPAEIYTADYEYDLSRFLTAASSNLNLNAIGRIGDGRFSFRSITSGNSYAGFSRRNINFDLERPNGQHFIAGDLGSGTSLSLMSTNIRGFLVTMPFGDYSVTAFGGRSSSGSSLRGPRERVGGGLASGDPQFDTTLAGGYVTKKFAPFTVSAGGMMFGGLDASRDLCLDQRYLCVRTARFRRMSVSARFAGRRPTAARSTAGRRRRTSLRATRLARTCRSLAAIPTSARIFCRLNEAFASRSTLLRRPLILTRSLAQRICECEPSSASGIHHGYG